MGANAVTTVPVYTAGEVLTAADLNITNSGIPVFATTVTRDAAFDGTGEKTLAEGQFAYIEATNTTQYYDGAAWQTVGTTPGLVCVKAETTFSGASSVTADNVFTSTYTNYMIKFRYITNNTVQPSFKLRVGGVSASTNYNYQYINGNASATGAAGATGQTSANFALYSNGDFKSAATLELFSPQIAEATNYHSLVAWSPASYNSLNAFYAGNHSTATAYDGIEFLVSAGTMTGAYTIYGYSKAV
jgi:hypothetical protein